MDDSRLFRVDLTRWKTGSLEKRARLVYDTYKYLQSSSISLACAVKQVHSPNF